MERTTARAAVKPLRADARRNRDQLLAAAIALLPQKGSQLSLEAVARRAGVSIATLYRHFPTREALILAVHHQEMTSLADEAGELAATLPAEQALQRWLHRLGRYGSTRPGLGDAFRTAALTGEELLEETYQVTVQALDLLIAGAAAAGHARPDVRGGDVLLALCGVWDLPDTPASRAQTDRVVGLLLDGLATLPGSSSRETGEAPTGSYLPPR
ncbi:helix-turn-helix domain-containing protein [Streptomyces sp. DSM 44915]|uniref:Helix-turn-helix domain-containing protein n=1 Tax=Streptomyces chisholmiae TaxID=3075540 RepID=A0ABU2JQM3_9ACTN|nr:helix-turn-helix domain-containing protein [Streptomyces sp. DSM 44915]MDT0267280.1 helix-turn-helix domain-containing protein [Streptomyces sp. DSM 44915]